ncbi:GFA family protein [Thalassospira marina]|uniref:Aldehyde-activating protein n=1 Tax=Thalassospira marina TaxID=2048283 RepID=A0ABM6QCX0_9PROT|nr:GFA family protein [Thalassospira marina]AUG54434.1 aldehyde-activating protein [Thalassospira marina]
MTTKPSFHTGGCLCGAVRFSVSGAPLGSNHCHCNMCRKDSGAGISTFVSFPASAVIWNGKPTDYESSPGKYRGFCPKCGSSITWRKASDDSFIDFRLGTFDDPSAFRAQKHLWMRNALKNFADIDPGADHFD